MRLDRIEGGGFDVRKSQPLRHLSGAETGGVAIVDADRAAGDRPVRAGMRRGERDRSEERGERFRIVCSCMLHSDLDVPQHVRHRRQLMHRALPTQRGFDGSRDCRGNRIRVRLRSPEIEIDGFSQRVPCRLAVVLGE